MSRADDLLAASLSGLGGVGSKVGDERYRRRSACFAAPFATVGTHPR